jgi:hypothetical protein
VPPGYVLLGRFKLSLQIKIKQMNYLITTFIVAINGEQQTMTAGNIVESDVYSPVNIKQKLTHHFRKVYPNPHTVAVVVLDTISVSEEHYYKTALGRLVL